MKTSAKTSTRKIVITLFVALAVVLPLVTAMVPRRSPLLSFLSTVMPLATVLCVYFLLRRTARDAGKSLRTLWQEKTEIPEASALTLQKLLGCSEWAVLSTIYTDVVLLKKSRLGMAKSYRIYRYVGKIKTGIQLDKCEFHIDVENRRIEIKLPPVQVFDHSIDIDNIEMFDEKSSLFSKISNTELFAEISRRKENALQRLVAHGLLEATESRTRLELTQLVSAMGYMDYDISMEALPPAALDSITEGKSLFRGKPEDQP